MNKTGYPSVDKTHLQGIPEEKLHPKILPLSMLATFLEINKDHLDETAIEEQKTGRQFTKGELRMSSVTVARALLSFGLKPGDKIALITENCYEGILVMFGANAVGIQVAAFNPITCQDRETLNDEIDTFEPSIIFFSNKDVDWIDNIVLRDAHPYLQRVIVVAGTQPFHSYGICYTFDDFLSVNAAPSLDETLAVIDSCSLSKDDAPMLYLKTSGSVSGRPKTLPFSNRAIFASMVYASNSTGTKTRDSSVNRVLCQVPWQYGYGWMPLFVNLMGGNQVVLVDGSDEDVANFHKLKPSYIYGTPVTLRQFMDFTPEDADLSSLTAFFCAGAGLSETEYQIGIDYFRKRGSDCEIRNNYGVSEGLCIGTSSDGIAHRPNTSGKFYIGPEWLIVDEDLHEVKYDEVGEVIFTSESLCQGYYKNPEATEESFITLNGKTFFRTGDYMSLSEDGYVTFIGRKRRFFVAQGILDKVNCETIEQGMDSLDIVIKSAVIVARDERGVEGAKAFVLLEDEFLSSFDSKDLDVDVKIELAIRERLSKVLQPFQIPRDIVIVKEIPLLNSGKINYRLLETM